MALLGLSTGTRPCSMRALGPINCSGLSVKAGAALLLLPLLHGLLQRALETLRQRVARQPPRASGEGAAVGEVVAVQKYGAGDLLEIRPATGGATILVPFTEDIVPEVDMAAGWLLVVPPEGLLD